VLTGPKKPAPKPKPRVSLWSVVAKLPPPRTVAARAPRTELRSIWKAQRPPTAVRLRSVFSPRKPL
jgi:hypothetical protein